MEKVTKTPLQKYFEPEIQELVEQMRPPEEIRAKLDVGFSFEKQDLILFEISPMWTDKNKKIQSPFAKAKFVKSKNIWQIFWRRASGIRGKWERYKFSPEVNSLEDFFKLVDEDEYHCFKG